jgi:hypothetical protein
MILLDENGNLPMVLWFLNLLCVSSQSLFSKSVLPNCVVPQRHTLNTSKKKSQTENLSHFFKDTFVSTIHAYIMNSIQSLLFKNRTQLSSNLTFYKINTSSLLIELE